MNERIYDIDFKKLSVWLTLVNLRESRLIAFLSAFIQPVVVLHNLFLNYRSAKAYELKTTGQVCYLEAFLNDRFDFSLRRIKIVDTQWKRVRYLYRRIEERPIPVYRRSEDKPVYIYARAETVGNTLVDFVIKVPADVVFQEPEMRAMVSRNLCGRMYKIETV